MPIFSWKKVTKNRLLLHPAPTLRYGVPSLRSCSGRTALYGPSWASALSGHPWPPPPCASPPLGLLKSLVDLEPDQEQQPRQRLANRCALALFIYQRICGVAGRAAPCDLRWHTGLFAGQARSYRYSAEFKIRAIPVGAAVRRSDLPREEARISTTHATIKNNANPDATGNLATSGGRVQSLVDQDQQPGQRQANRCALALFIYQRICGVAGRAAPCDLHWQYRPLRGTSPLLQVLRKF
ncbi:hypothetical protein J3B00_001326 [Pseudomonas sp. BP8]|nr:hypothetical protein [Pseudomonas sp. BP8]